MTVRLIFSPSFRTMKAIGAFAVWCPSGTPGSLFGRDTGLSSRFKGMSLRPPKRHFRDSSERWEDNGCSVCRGYWAGSERREDVPQLLGAAETYMVDVYRCQLCGAYWEAGFVNPREISFAAARDRLPNLDDIEAALGWRGE